MNDRKFDLTLVEKKPTLKFTLIPVNDKTVPKNVEDMTTEEIRYWAQKYDADHPWWIETEKELGEKIRAEKQLDMDTLKKVVHGKFKNQPGRETITLNRLSIHTEDDVTKITREGLSKETDEERIKTICRLYGVGISLASTILTFLDSESYGVYDIHVYRELYGNQPSDMFSNHKHYLNMLMDLRNLSKRHGLSVRFIEKALFKKNFDS